MIINLLLTYTNVLFKMIQLRFILITLTTMLSISVAGQDYKLPPYQKFVLKNGLTVYLMEQREVPMINVSVILPAGAIYDGEKTGLASLTASALKHGTRSYSKTALDEELDFMGASVSTYASKESAGLSAQFAAKDKEKVMQIIYEMLTAPAFDTVEFGKEKRIVLARLDQAKESPAVCNRILLRQVLVWRTCLWQYNTGYAWLSGQYFQ